MNNCRIVSKLPHCFGKLVLLVLILLSGAAVAQALTRTPPATIPIVVAPRLVVAEARLPIRLQKVDVRAEVLGSAAHTRIEMVFYNPNERALEGELQFPLMDGQTVTGFALDINGEMRPAVPVDKVKGRQVFEDVIRTRVDPALLEKTQGNNYKLRIYPLPAKGTRRVALELDESLSLDTTSDINKGVDYIAYSLPLQFAETVEQLDVTVQNPASPDRLSAPAVRARLGAERIKVNYARDREQPAGSSVSFSRKNYSGKGTLSISFPQSEKFPTATGTRDDRTYFYAEVSPPASKPVPRTAPGKLGLIWDASGSGGERDHGREFALLEAYFKALGSVTTELIVVRDRAEKIQSFTVKNGDWSALRTVLQDMVYDGATNAEALSPTGTADLTLLFTDGLCNYGKGAFAAGKAPLYAVNASTGADMPRLRAAAESTGGRLLNLLNIGPAEAVQELTHQAARLFGMSSNRATELVAGSVYAEGKRMKIAGILTEPQAVIELDWIDARGRHEAQQVEIRSAATPATSLAAYRWATFQLEHLEADYSANRTAILRLGKRFGMATRETSLIVLDRVEDYVRYEITPPESLRGMYESLLAQKVRQLDDQRSNHLNQIAERFAQKVAWWGKTFPKDKPEVKPLPTRESRQETVAAPAPAEVRIQAEARVQADVRAQSQAEDRARADALRMVSRKAMAPHTVKAESAPPEEASIRLKKWEPDAPYVKRLREASPEQMYRVYLDERPSYTASTAFFLDAADIFLERGQTELGLRILSNLAEMNLENRHILRILAYRLLQAKQTGLALPILRQVLVLSPEEPQSLRDLGLAYAEDEQYQAAVDNLWEVVFRPWNDRFPDIELVALAELNAIAARVPQGTLIDTGRMDSRLLRNLPLELRAVLSWDADNTDIDLWVTDPNGEKVFYANRLSYQGGSISRDFTGGYGPEEFSLRTAKPGTYKVQANFFGNRQQVVSGATTLMLRLSTGFGTPQQKDENIILRLSGTGSTVDVGTFEIGKETGK